MKHGSKVEFERKSPALLSQLMQRPITLSAATPTRHMIQTVKASKVSDRSRDRRLRDSGLSGIARYGNVREAALGVEPFHFCRIAADGDDMGSLTDESADGGNAKP